MILNDILEPKTKKAVRMYNLKKSPETLRSLISKQIQYEENPINVSEYQHIFS